MKQTEEGIFLHRTSFSDSSLIVTFYTQNSGLRKFVFKGGKKKAHQLYPMAVAELTYYGRPESDLLQLTAAETVLHTDYQFDPIKSTIAFFLAECVRKSVHEFDADAHIFQFLKQTSTQLNNQQENIGVFPVEFLVSFSEFLGMQPLVEADPRVFDLDEGTIGAQAHPGNRSTSGAHVQFIAECIQGKTVPTSKAVREAALQTMMEYYTIHVSRLNQFETFTIVKEILS